MKKIILGLIAVIGVAIAIYTATERTDIPVNENYEKEIQAHRKDLDEDFRGEGSPLREEERNTFEGLSYFPINPDFKVKAELEWVPYQQRLDIPTTQGKMRTYLKRAIAHIELMGGHYHLSLLQDEFPPKGMENTYTLAFTDKTSGHTTYGGGRYLNVEVSGGQREVVIDFNKAYNPYCAYNPDYDCVIPLKDNHIGVAVKAGEKAYEGKK
ncbi:DUF1684 domain-containing protein [Algivirga pacifica]|uniref:DUF1684 domain-containing protein n=1 Tax=Algivirga pacifica TaxID=1162670 RepID=A0ABP9DB86_9BACT